MRWAAFGTLLLSACLSDISAPERGLPEDRGTTTGAVADRQHTFAWAPDGSAIAYVSADGMPLLERVPVPSGEAGTIDGPRSAYGDLASATDGTVYAVADTGGGRVLFRIAADSTTRLGVPPADEGVVPADGSHVLVTTLGTLFVVAPDSVFLDDGARSLIALGCTRLVIESADGSSILCRSGMSYRTVDLATGAGTAITLLPAADGMPLLVDWPADGLRVFHRMDGGYGMRIAGDAESTLVWEAAPGGAEVPDETRAAWAPDGARVAFWTHACIDGVVGSCVTGQSVLRVLHIASGDERIAAVAHGPVPAEYVAFSPDGSRLGYVFDGMIYTVPAP